MLTFQQAVELYNKHLSDIKNDAAHNLHARAVLKLRTGIMEHFIQENFIKEMTAWKGSTSAFKSIAELKDTPGWQDWVPNMDWRTLSGEFVASQVQLADAMVTWSHAEAQKLTLGQFGKYAVEVSMSKTILKLYHTLVAQGTEVEELKKKIANLERANQDLIDVAKGKFQ